MRLLAEMLQTLKIHQGGRIASVRITQEMVVRVGAGPGDSEGLIDVPRSIAGVEVVALLRELEDGSFKVSLRSRGEVDVEKVARHHGGGGHRNAAGFALAGGADDLEGQVVAELSEILA